MRCRADNRRAMRDTDTNFDRLRDISDAIPDERDGMSIGQLGGRIGILIAWGSPIWPSEVLSSVWVGEREHKNIAGPFACRADGYETDRRSQ